MSGGPNFAYSLVLSALSRDPSQLPMDSIDLRSWDTAYCGAEPVRSDTIKKFCEAMKVYGFQASSFYPVYGLAEATLLVSHGDVDNPRPPSLLL